VFNYFNKQSGFLAHPVFYRKLTFLCFVFNGDAAIFLATNMEQTFVTFFVANPFNLAKFGIYLFGSVAVRDILGRC